MSLSPFYSISPNMLETLEKVSILAKINRPVLIIGERGTGKELIANRLHYLSNRWEQKFLKVNCAAFSEELLDSELFGHEMGSFTGASKQKKGKFEVASSGTLFFDEIGLTSMKMQEKLLRVIEYGEFERVGGNETLKTQTRIIGATNLNLPQEVEKSTFRADLLDRLAFDVILIPPLRERRADILHLAEKFAINMCIELKKNQFSGFSEDVCKNLLDYSWPGNIRQLKNVIERAIFYQEDNGKELSSIIIDPFKPSFSEFSPIISKDTISPNTLEIKQVKEVSNLEPSPTYSITLDRDIDFDEEVLKLEKALITKAGQRNKYNQTKTAKSLNISYHKLRGLIKKLNIDFS